MQKDFLARIYFNIFLLLTVAAPNSAYSNQAFYTIRAGGRAGKFPVGGRPIGLKRLLMW